MPLAVPRFLDVCWGLTLSPHARVASSLRIEPSPRIPWNPALLSISYWYLPPPLRTMAVLLMPPMSCPFYHECLADWMQA